MNSLEPVEFGTARVCLVMLSLHMTACSRPADLYCQQFPLQFTSLLTRLDHLTAVTVLRETDPNC